MSRNSLIIDLAATGRGNIGKLVRYKSHVEHKSGGLVGGARLQYLITTCNACRTCVNSMTSICEGLKVRWKGMRTKESPPPKLPREVEGNGASRPRGVQAHDARPPHESETVYQGTRPLVHIVRIGHWYSVKQMNVRCVQCGPVDKFLDIRTIRIQNSQFYSLFSSKMGSTVNCREQFKDI
uniref:Uncharacterized protein n=1 Tax=Timema shepardi TaxID=629360 RepID=A0A7R9ANN3_TIMSH|nr:unnamed protein product [Timema shepardi]